MIRDYLDKFIKGEIIIECNTKDEIINIIDLLTSKKINYIDGRDMTTAIDSYFPETIKNHRFNIYFRIIDNNKLTICSDAESLPVYKYIDVSNIKDINNFENIKLIEYLEYIKLKKARYIEIELSTEYLENNEERRYIEGLLNNMGGKFEPIIKDNKWLGYRVLVPTGFKERVSISNKEDQVEQNISLGNINGVELYKDKYYKIAYYLRKAIGNGKTVKDGLIGEDIKIIDVKKTENNDVLVISSLHGDKEVMVKDVTEIIPTHLSTLH